MHQLQMTNFIWWCFPVIVFPVQVSDRSTQQFFRCHVVKARYIDRIELTPARRAPGTKRVHTAVPAKLMVIHFCSKLITYECRPTRQQTEQRWLNNSGPEPDFHTNGTVAPDGALAEVDICFKANATAMTASTISLHLRPLLFWIKLIQGVNQLRRQYAGSIQSTELSSITPQHGF